MSLVDQMMEKAAADLDEAVRALPMPQPPGEPSRHGRSVRRSGPVLAAGFVAVLLMGVPALLLDTTPSMEPGSPVDIDYIVDPEFVEGVLEDGVVTAEEYELTYRQMYRCMVDGGIEGRVAFDPDLAYDFPSVLSHRSQTHLDEVITECESSIQPVVSVYMSANPITPALVERQRQGILDCVRRDTPQIFRDLSPDWDIETLRLWLIDETARYGTDAQGLANDCMGGYGADWIDIGEAAVSEPAATTVASGAGEPGETLNSYLSTLLDSQVRDLPGFPGDVTAIKLAEVRQTDETILIASYASDDGGLIDVVMQRLAKPIPDEVIDPSGTARTTTAPGGESITFVNKNGHTIQLIAVDQDGLMANVIVEQINRSQPDQPSDLEDITEDILTRWALSLLDVMRENL